MTSTGEVACMDYSLAGALIKAMMAAGLSLPELDKPILITVRKEDREKAVKVAKNLLEAGYRLIATSGTAEYLRKAGVFVETIGKISERPDIIDALMRREIGLVVNIPTVAKRETISDGYMIRRTATEFQIPVLTRIETALALSSALKEGISTVLHIQSLNEFVERAPLGREV
jgi:carbamoyl-phosphate synthase large subunit